MARKIPRGKITERGAVWEVDEREERSTMAEREPFDVVEYTTRLIGGDADGIRLYNFTGDPMMAVVVPRDRVAEAKSLPDIPSCGVYYLLELRGGRPARVYAGQTAQGVARLERRRNPPFDFSEHGITEGGFIELYDARAGKPRPDIKAQVCGKRKIRYKGKATTMSAVAKRIMKFKSSPKGAEYWTYNGKRLIDIYREKYPSS